MNESNRCCGWGTLSRPVATAALRQGLQQAARARAPKRPDSTDSIYAASCWIGSTDEVLNVCKGIVSTRVIEQQRHTLRKGLLEAKLLNEKDGPSQSYSRVLHGGINRLVDLFCRP